MQRKLSLGAIVLVLFALAAVVVASASGDGGKHEFTLLAKTIQESEIDLPPEGEFGQGDQFVFTDDLFRDGKPVGQTGGVCTATRLAGETLTLHCATSFSLKDGQITIQGLVTFPDAAIEPFTVAITGGTGAYKGANGEVRVEVLNDTDANYTFVLK